MAEAAEVKVKATVMVSPAKCLGFMGWVFGHKYVKKTLEYEYTDNYCYRCGLPKGSTRKVEQK